MNILAADFLLNLISFVHIFCLFNKVSLYQYSYSFETKNCSDIIFFSEEQPLKSSSEKNDVEFNFILLNDKSLPHKRKTHVFTYRKDNFVSFQILEDTLNSRLSPNQNGKIQCNINLAFSLKLTKDITAIPDKVNFDLLLGVFSILKYLKANYNKNLKEFIQALILKTYLNLENNSSKIEFAYSKEYAVSNIWSILDFYIKKEFILAHLKCYMIKYIYNEGNLILLKTNNEKFNTSIFEEDIPYKSLLIKDYKIFMLLEKILKFPEIFNAFQILLNEMNLKSLILMCFTQDEISNNKSSFLIFSLNSFKSIMLYNVQSSSSFFLRNFIAASEHDLEFIKLENVNIPTNVLYLLLQQTKLKGLAIKNISIPGNLPLLDQYMVVSERFDYIKFQNVKINSIWWNTFFSKAIVHTLITSFNSISAEKYFIEEFNKVSNVKNFFHLEIIFYFAQISKEFCDSLCKFENLRTLKLRRYVLDKQTESNLFGAVMKMIRLENLTIQNYHISNTTQNDIFEKKGLKTLHIENEKFMKTIFKVEFKYNFESLNRICFKYITIERVCLIGIFELKGLEYLSFDHCYFEPFANLKFPNFRSRKLKFLYFNRTIIENINSVDFLNNLDCLEILDLSYSRSQLGYLISLNLMSNKTLRILLFEAGILGTRDLHRIKQMEFLEELDISYCEFSECHFFELSAECKFFNSLKVLNLWYVEINCEDLRYLLNFKNLTKISLTFYNHNHMSEKDCLFCIMQLIRSSNSRLEVSLNPNNIYYRYVKEI
ncbi:hypothetical protein CWI36_0851p0010 [Hamiltosporidium magnivora]|uniref:Uncharacterized protein n=1 Tax=Hamiltosporidium magnivora TaxID=148818 RepID=A0A4Q9L841_9MICR|nr:hypothetical protein CWI36_0851p0010 [Hamiltosporidium magnivora]